MASPQDELVVIVDRDNNVIGSTTRRQMRAESLIHRATYVFVFHPSGGLYVQLRTTTKDIYPGYYDLAAGGVMQAGETYEESAVRELEEEMGITGVPLELWFDFYFEDPSNGGKVWGRAFSCTYDGPLRLQPEEVQSVDILPVDEILSGASNRQFTPDSLLALRRSQESST